MDWVAGRTLDSWVAEQVRHNRAEPILRIAHQWRDLMKSLATQGIVHGDLEPENIMVQPDGSLVLVDYDCLSAPAMIGLPNPETGTPPYQHPDRNSQTPVFAGLDNFSALVIYVALRALAVDPRLWDTHAPTPFPGQLLFLPEDFSQPERSRLYRDLLASRDAQVRKLTHYLFQLWRGGLHDVPSIDEVLLWCDSLESLLEQRDFDRAVQLVSRMGPQERIEPCQLPAIDDALRRVSCRRSLQAAVESGQAAEIERYYVPELLADYPAATLVGERASQFLEAARILKLLEAARAAEQWDEFASLWNTHGGKLNSNPAARACRVLFDKLSAVQRLQSLVDDPTSDDAEIACQWQAVHEDGEPPHAEHLAEAVERRRMRQALFEQVSQQIATSCQSPTYAGDMELRRLWKAAERLGETRLEVRRSQERAAKQRIRRLRYMNDLTRAPTLLGEQQIAASLRFLPPDYHPKMPGRIQLASQRLDAARVLTTMAHEPASERELLVAWSTVVAAKGQMLIGSACRDRVVLAERRVALIEALRPIVALAPEERDRRLLELWDDSLLAGCGEAMEMRPRWLEARVRADLLARLETALAADDHIAIECLLADSRLVNYDLPAPMAALLDSYRQRFRQVRAEQRQSLVQAILDHDASKFAEMFDRELITQLCAQASRHQRIIGSWTEQEILPLAKCGLGVCEPGGWQWVGPRRLRLRWSWPVSAMTNRCQLTVSRDHPQRNTIPDDLDLLHSMMFERGTTDAGTPAAEFEVPPEWDGAEVFVWAVVDLGFQTFYSEPLGLGQLHLPDQ